MANTSIRITASFSEFDGSIVAASFNVLSLVSLGPSFVHPTVGIIG